MKFNQRERVLLFITIGAVIFYFWYQFLYSPGADRIEKLKQELSAITSKSSMVQEKMKAYNGLNNTSIQLVPKDVQLEKIVLHASKYPNMNILSITPKTQEGSIKIEIVCQGGLDAFKRYLRSFNDLKLPLQIDSVNIDSGTEGLDIRLTLISYF